MTERKNHDLIRELRNENLTIIQDCLKDATESELVVEYMSRKGWPDVVDMLFDEGKINLGEAALIRAAIHVVKEGLRGKEEMSSTPG